MGLIVPAIELDYAFRRMKTIAAGVLPFVLSLLASVTSVSCGGKVADASPAPPPSPCDWDYQVLDESDLLASASLQVAVFDEDCPTRDTLVRGDLSQARVVESVPSGQSLPTFCELPAAVYCMVAVATRDCAVVGFGATPFDLSHHKHVTTAIQPVDSPISQCTGAQECVNGACVLADAGAPEGAPDGSSGPWTLVAVGQLPMGTDPGGALSSLCAVLTPAGFVVTYRDHHASDGGADGVRVFVSDDGAMGTATRFALSSCSGATDAGGAAAWSDLAATGFEAMREPACSAIDAPSMHVSLFDAHGATTDSAEYPLPDEIRLAPVHGAAAAPGGPQFLLAGASSSGGNLYTFDGTVVQSSMTPAGAKSSYAEVASSDKVLAVLADDSVHGGVTVSVATPGSTADPALFGAGTLAHNAALVAWDDRVLATLLAGDQVL